MVIFFGLGNNALEYTKTKHNIGRIVLENLVDKLELSFSKGNGFSYAKGSFLNTQNYFVYSQDFMNTSGEALYKFIDYFKLKIDSETLLIIFQDDSDQFEGKNKISQNGGSAGHKGIESIYKHIPKIGLAKNQLWKLKIGIRPENNKLKSETFVLKTISKNDDLNINNLGVILFENFSKINGKSIHLLQNLINTNIQKLDKTNPKITKIIN